VVASVAPPASESAAPLAVPQGCLAITSPVAGSVWKLAAAVGAVIQAGDPIVIVEAMKTEIVVAATAAGTVQSLLVAPGAPVTPGQVLAFVQE
jgi:urea carboxylase